MSKKFILKVMKYLPNFPAFFVKSMTQLDLIKNGWTNETQIYSTI